VNRDHRPAAEGLLEAAIQARSVLRTAASEAEPGTAKERVLAHKIELLSDKIGGARAAGFQRPLQEDV